MTLEKVPKIDYYKELVSTCESSELAVKTYHNLLYLVRYISTVIIIIISS